jgi:hypothetical protein
MTERRARKILIFACVNCLFALALMAWSVIAPTPLSVMVAMTAGQGLGTISLGLYVWVVIADLRRARILDQRKDE